MTLEEIQGWRYSGIHATEITSGLRRILVHENVTYVSKRGHASKV